MITALHAQVKMWKALRAMHVQVLLLLTYLLVLLRRRRRLMTDRKTNANKHGQL